MEIRRLKTGDEMAAIAAIHELKPPGERDEQDASVEHMGKLLSENRNYLYAAFADDQPVGFLLAYRLPRVDRDQDMVYLYEICVLPQHRRRGIGTKMIQLFKEECHFSKIMQIWVGTETGNAAARALYESTGAKCEGENYAEYTYRDI